MDKSESIAKLAQALVNAQADFPMIPMNSYNKFYDSKYADLGDVIKACKPILKENQLSVTQLVGSDGDMISVTTILLHSSAEYLSSTVSIKIDGKNIAQEAGKAITYLRRYAYTAILGLYADEDTDGNSKDKKKPEQKQEQKPQEKHDLDWAMAYATPMGVFGEMNLDQLVALEGKPMKPETKQAYLMVRAEREK